VNEIKIRLAAAADIAIIYGHDKHISVDAIKEKIKSGEIFVVYDDAIFAGWLRYNLFWDSIPFMNMLFLLPEYRGRGIGKRLVEFWENSMKEQGHKKVLTSTPQNENAQYFYAALGYAVTGGFTLSGDPYEIIFEKSL